MSFYPDSWELSNAHERVEADAYVDPLAAWALTLDGSIAAHPFDTGDFTDVFDAPAGASSTCAEGADEPAAESAPDDSAAPRSDLEGKVANKRGSRAPLIAAGIAALAISSYALDPQPSAYGPDSDRAIVPVDLSIEPSAHTGAPMDSRESYVVEPGDSLWSILSDRVDEGSIVEAIDRTARLNGLGDARSIVPGQELALPSEYSVGGSR